MRPVRSLTVLTLVVGIGALAPVVRPAPVLAACAAHADEVTVLEDHTVFVDALANDAGCNHVKSVSPPAHGQIADDPVDDVNNWTYTPATDYSGPDENHYTATFDGSTESGAFVTYTVVAVNDPPLVGTWGGLVGLEDLSAALNLYMGAAVGPFDESGQVLSISSVTSSNPGLFAEGPALSETSASSNYRNLVLTWTPFPNACGTSTETVTFKDNGGTANGGSDTKVHTFDVSVTCQPDPPTATGDSWSVRPGTSLVVAAPGVLANDSDPDGDQLTASKGSEPSHGSVTLGADGSLTYTPNAGYTGSDSFKYYIDDGHMGSGYAFVTINVDGTAPLSTARTPAAGSTGRPRDTIPTIAFTEAMNPATITGSTLKMVDLSTGSPLSAIASYSAATKRATLAPSSLLPAGHRVKVYATSRIKDLAGNALAGTSWTFTVTGDATRPTVVTKSPAPSSTGVARSANVTAKFSEQVRSSTVTASTVRLQDTATGSIVPATVAYDAGTRRAILDPSSRLAARRMYKVLLSSSIRDKAGNRLPATSWTFRTGG